MVSMIHIMRKAGCRVSDQVQHKPDCTKTEDGYRLDFFEEVEGLYYLCT